MTFMTEHGEDVPHVKDENVAYEVHVESADTMSKGYREVFVGVEVESLAEVPVELLVKVLPAATYVVFTLRGEEIASDWSMTIGEWMQHSTYEPVGNYGIQRYDERFRGWKAWKNPNWTFTFR